MKLPEREVDRLLHDAEHADSAAMMAGAFRDFVAERALKAKRDNLLDEANALDPKRLCAAWQESRLTSSPPTGGQER